MPQFRVGDRVKYIDRGWSSFLVLNEEYTVIEVNDLGSVYVPDGARRRGPYHAERFELVAPPVPVQRPGTVFYTYVYRNPQGVIKAIGHSTEREYNEGLAACEALGYEILAKKKLTLTLNQEV